jgi:hypothetical protein
VGNGVVYRAGGARVGYLVECHTTIVFGGVANARRGTLLDALAQLFTQLLAWLGVSGVYSFVYFP